MLIFPDAVTDITATLEGARVVSVEHQAINDWPSVTQLDSAMPGELWVSKDLAGFYQSSKDKCMSDDFTSVDALSDGSGRLRVYRALDVTWYAWLYKTLSKHKAAGRFDDKQWKNISSRFNLLWTVARRWYGAAEVAAIHAKPFHYLTMDYYAPEADKGTAARFNARNKIA